MHERNSVEKAVILALAFRAGLFNRLKASDIFAVRSATVRLDRGLGFDLEVINLRSGGFLLVDITGSQKFRGKKIARATNKEKPSHGKKRWGWRFILKGDWQNAAFDIGINPCFRESFDRISDGKLIALGEACPKHGNRCDFARELFRFSEVLNRQFAEHRRKGGSLGQAAEFVMTVPEPPFK